MNIRQSQLKVVNNVQMLKSTCSNEIVRKHEFMPNHSPKRNTNALQSKFPTVMQVFYSFDDSSS